MANSTLRGSDVGATVGTGTIEVTSDSAHERIFVASQWQLMWWRFRKHRIALFSTLIVFVLAVIALGGEFFAVRDPEEINAKYLYASPTRIHFVDAAGRVSLRPFVYGVKIDRDPETLRWLYSENTSTKNYLRFFVHGFEYEFWGLFDADLHLLGLDDPNEAILLLGTDSMGRDVFSRVIYGTRISMSIGLVGVAMSLSLGILLGGISGYYGGGVDLLIQRVIEFLRSIPTIPLWMSLAAALPANLPPLRVYFYITVILSLISWTGLARVVRGRFLSLRSEDFVMAARLAGSGELRIILRHMVPSFLSHIIAQITLAIPSMILSETSLSFLGLGLRSPIISWGVLLQDAQNVRTVALAPWLLTPGLAVVVAVLAFNFLGDGLRDAADPYGR